MKTKKIVWRDESHIEFSPKKKNQATRTISYGTIADTKWALFVLREKNNKGHVDIIVQVAGLNFVSTVIHQKKLETAESMEVAKSFAEYYFRDFVNSLFE